MGLSVKEYVSADGEAVALLVDANGIPLLLPNRFVMTEYRLRGLSHHTIRQVLGAIAATYLWATCKGINFDQVVFREGSLKSHQVDDLADFLGYSAFAHGLVINNKLAVLKQAIKAQPQAKPKIFIGDIEFGNKLRFVSKYFDWLVHERPRQGLITDARLLTSAADTLRRRVPRQASTYFNEKLEALDESVIENLVLTLHPDNSGNPFTRPFIKARNYLLLMLLIECGGRRNEILNVKTKDVQASSRELDIRVSKTRPRTIPFSRLTEDAFNRYFEEHWVKLPRGVRSNGYLFVTERGGLMTLRNVNAIFEKIRSRLDEVPTWLHPHSLRRSFVERVIRKIKELQARGIQFEHGEIAQRVNDLGGWAKRSEMGSKYASRLMRKSADHIAQAISNDMTNKVGKVRSDG